MRGPPDMRRAALQGSPNRKRKPSQALLQQILPTVSTGKIPPRQRCHVVRRNRLEAAQASAVRS
jgi:hypothetical protein